ncbi:MAG: RsmE family RNA methyltransferase [Alkalispirochaeta sp.]
MNLVLFDHCHDTYQLAQTDDRTRHILRVLRSEEGDTIRVGVVGGRRGSATVTEISPTGITLQATWEADRNDLLPVAVLVGHPRPPVLQRLLRDLTALRVAEIHVFTGALSDASYLDSSLWRKTDRVIREGLSQGMHTAPPTLRRWASLAVVLKAMAGGPWESNLSEVRAYGAIGSPARTLPDFIVEVQDSRTAGGVAIAIGPERGFTPDEETLLSDHGFSAVGLGSSTLRTETATIILAGAVCATLS